MNLNEAREAIQAILDQIPDDALPQPDSRDDYAHEKYGTCHWFGSVGYYVGSCRNGKGESIPSSHRQGGLSDLFQRETMQRLENEFWANRDAEVSA